ncbi:MarR family winged helix-turn-helix transcriptional regulator [Blastococcus mobilis]|uniref:DNA-binding transcriptional regulator, MarR family n=1 Tax=Blastococcus mobilis TaxID=1938746 RepID=A0A238WID7_9ACTN|nr:MarR family transcriptional regulator [Blastococcus mobilis]SNR46208.1 DNA-binding transcriptional regulator, MarR family [Blastococcus mobilis]
MARDRVSDYLEQWRRERPDLDPAPMGVVGRLSRASELISRTTRAYFADHGLQAGEFDVLATLRRSGAPFTLTPGQLAESTMVSSAAITNRLSRLEDKGLLVRRTDPSNRRNVLVALTDDGLALVDDIVEGHLENERRLLTPLAPEEQEQLAVLLARFLAGSGDGSHEAGTEH